MQMNEVCFVPTKLNLGLSLFLKVVVVGVWAFFIVLPLAFIVRDPNFLKEGLTISLSLVVMLLVGSLLFRKFKMKDVTTVTFSPKGVRVTYKEKPFEEYAAWDEIKSVEFDEGDSESSAYYIICGTFRSRHGIEHGRRLSFEYGCWTSKGKMSFRNALLEYNPHKERMKL